MALESGTRLGPYQVTDPLGKGGMGEVYRARDTKLGREVAIKTLPDEFAQDADRVARFQREAKLLAALNHPNIAAIYGLEESDGKHFLVLELVEGDTLGDRLQRGAIPVEESFKLALQIAEALEAAHEKGVIHRDLKPANIKITPEGRVKVLDFGLAKGLSSEGTEVDLTNSPTLSATATQPGVLLGTAAYMSPEQARGQSTDHRSDIWAFGAVLFEMLAGHRAFPGDSVSDTLASVLAREPDFAALPVGVGARVRRVLVRCLDKDPDRRWQSTSDLRIEIDDLIATPGEVEASAIVTGERGFDRRRALALGATALGTAGLGGVLGWFLKPSDVERGWRFVGEDVLPDGRALSGLGGPASRRLDLSPDGSRYVYVSRGLWIRPMDDPGGTFRVQGVEETSIESPTFSPDGRRLAYWSAADASLKVSDVEGGQSRQVISMPGGLGSAVALVGDLSWGREDEILLSGLEGILSVSPSSGVSDILIPALENELLLFPRHLPGDDGVLFLKVSGDGTGGGLEAYSRASGDRRLVDLPVARPIAARFLPSGGPGQSSGHLVFFEAVAEGAGGRGRGAGTPAGAALAGLLNTSEISLSAIAFDPATLRATGRVERLLTDVRFPQCAVSGTGELVYIPGAEAPLVGNGVLTWVDPDTGISQPIPGIEPGPYRHPRLSPDGTRLAFERNREGGADVLVHDLDGSSAPRLLPGGGSNLRPLWKDDSWLSFVSNREGGRRVYRIPADFQGAAVPLTPAEWPEPLIGLEPDSWSPDGTTLALTTIPQGPRRVSILEDGQTAPVLYAPPEALGAEFSPDGRWIVYRRNNDVRSLVVKRFPDTGETPELALETADGSYPVFSKDADAGGSLRLFYRHEIGVVAGTGFSGAGVAGLAALFAIDLTLEPRVTYSPERALPIAGFMAYGDQRDYDVARDGRFVVVLPDEAGPPPPGIRIRLNWFDELNERVPVP